MDKEKAYLVIHPKAEQHVAAIVNVLEERWDTMPLVTRYAGHGIEMVENAPEQGYHWIIALGGDGTLNEVVNGAMKAQQSCTVAVLPGGTANDWAHEIGLPENPTDAARALIKSTSRRMDIGHVEVQELSFPQETLQQEATPSKPTTRHHFLATAGLGLDAAVIRSTSDSLRQCYGQLAFFLSWLETFPQIHHFPVQIQWSNRTSWEGQPWEVLVNNTRRYGSVIDVAPQAYVNDGLLDIRLLSYTDLLFHYIQDRSFSLCVPATTAMELDGSYVPLEDYVSQENWERLQEATDMEKVMVTYRFNVKSAALSMAVPPGYTGELFNGMREHDAAENIAPARTRLTMSAADPPVEGSRTIAFRATRVSQDPLLYVLPDNDAGPFLHVADIILRENNDPKEIFAHLIRLGSGSAWSHTALVCSLGDSSRGLNNALLVEARPRGIQLVNWYDEMAPVDQFTVGIKRPRLEWYVETPAEVSYHDPGDPEDGLGIDYLRHVCGIAVDQINGLYDTQTVYKLATLYFERIAKRQLGADPDVTDTTMRQLGAVPYVGYATGAMTDFFKRWQAVPALADFFKKWQEANYSTSSVMRFMCSGLVQYSFFEALRRRIMNDLAIPAHRDAAMSNLGNMQRVLFRDDPQGLIPTYVQQVQSGKRALSDPVPQEVIDLLKSAIPADFSTSPNLEWRSVIHRGVVWHIREALADYMPQSEEEVMVLVMLSSQQHLY